jgi:hypothetical protein
MQFSNLVVGKFASCAAGFVEEEAAACSWVKLLPTLDLALGDCEVLFAVPSRDVAHDRGTGFDEAAAAEERLGIVGDLRVPRPCTLASGQTVRRSALLARSTETTQRNLRDQRYP